MLGHIKAEMLKCCAYAPLAACKFYILTGEWGSLGLVVPWLCFTQLCSALLCLLCLLACCSSIIATCRKHKPRAGGEQEGSRAARSRFLDSPDKSNKSRGLHYTTKNRKKAEKKPKSSQAVCGVGNKLKQVPQVPHGTSPATSD